MVTVRLGQFVGLGAGLHIDGSPPAWEGSPGRSLCLTKSSACGRLWQFAHPRPLSLLQSGLAPRSKGMPGSSVHGAFQTRLLEWVDISSSKGSS